MKILLKVETFSQAAGDGAPTSFTLRDRRFRIRGIVDQWHGADHVYFKLVADDGNLYVIRHNLEENEWEMVLMEALSPDERKA
jgi:hypothetical protein